MAAEVDRHLRHVIRKTGVQKGVQTVQQTVVIMDSAIAPAAEGQSSIILPTAEPGGVLYGNAYSAWEILAGNQTSTRKFLSIIGDGSSPGIPEWIEVDTSSLCPKSRNISTTSPLSGGGNLNGDLTLSLAGLSTVGGANTIVGVNSGGSAWEYKAIIGDSTTGVVVSHTANQVKISLEDWVGTVKNIWIQANNQNPGNLTLSDSTNWGTQYSFISSIKVKTNSPDWDLWICETSAFNTALISTRKLAANRNGDFDITLNREYNSDGNNVYLIYTDNSGDNQASFYITGNKRSH
jgi:hypothetical protein